MTVAVSASQLIGNRFELGARVARGANGTVHRGVETSTHRPVAIKFLTPPSRSTSEALGRFAREAKALEELRHPAFVEMIDSGVDASGRPYLVTEWIDGPTLSELVATDGPLAADRLARLLAPVAAALDMAHARGFVHRDLKPDNIVIETDGDGERAKLLDFGLTRLVGGGADLNQNVTAAGMTVGTPEFLSPEQSLGRPFDHRADIYALGVTLFACLTGKLPFTGRNALQIMMAHVQAPPPRFADVRPDLAINASVEAVVRRALAKNPSERPASASELIAAMANASERVDQPLANPIPARVTAAPPTAPPAALARDGAGGFAAFLVASVILGMLAACAASAFGLGPLPLP